MPKLALLLAVVAHASALQLPSALTRRAALAAAPGFALAAAPLPSLAVKETGYAARSEVDASAVRALTATPGQGEKAGVRIGGTYKDPLHPGCPRKVVLSGSTVIVTGSDEDGKPWKVKGLVKGTRVLLDFTPKGGPKDVLAEYQTGVGLRFPDGNVWSK